MAKTWTLEDIMNLPREDLDEGPRRRQKLSAFVNPGDILPMSTIEDMRRYGYGAAGSPTDPTQDGFQFMEANGLTPAQYQQQYQALPFNFNDDGTATYDPSARVNSFSYEPKDSLFTQLMPMAIMALGGAGLTGMLPNTTNVFANGLAGLSPSSFDPSAFPSFMGDMAGSGGMGSMAGSAAPLSSGFSMNPNHPYWNMGAENLAGGTMSDAPSAFAGTQMSGSASSNVMNMLGDPQWLGGGNQMVNSLMNPSMGASWAELGNTLGAAGVGTPGATAAMGATTGLQGVLQGGNMGGGSWISSFLDNIFAPGTGGAPSAATSILRGIGGLGQYFGSEDNEDRLDQANKEAVARSDPFGDQRKLYQGELAKSYLDPNYFANNAVFKGIGNQTTNDLTRKMAAMGFSQSPGNLMGEIGSRLQDERMKYALGFQNQLGTLAGAGISPQESGRLQQQGALLQNNASNQKQEGIGTFLGALPGIYGAVKGWLP